MKDPEYERGERVYVGLTSSPENELLHLERYRLAASLLSRCHAVLDAACGSGYGSELIAGVGPQVVGLDISDHALAYARANYARSNVRFQQSDLEQPLPVGDDEFDGVVSFETLEHVAGQDGLLQEFRRVLKPGGTLIISTPESHAYGGVRASRNRFHIRELTKQEFIDLLAKHFTVRELYGQVRYDSAWWRRPFRWFMRFERVEIGAARLARTSIGLRVRHAVRPGRVRSSGSNIDRVDMTTPSDHVYLIAIASKS